MWTSVKKSLSQLESSSAGTFSSLGYLSKLDERLEVLVPAGKLVSWDVLVPGILVKVGCVGLSHYSGQDGGDQAPTVQALPVKPLKVEKCSEKF
jgi:hypothetical protein